MQNDSPQPLRGPLSSPRVQGVLLIALGVLALPTALVSNVSLRGLRIGLGAVLLVLGIYQLSRTRRE
jgi:uncharacterized membrane protein HdeD (DUF308 family)